MDDLTPFFNTGDGLTTSAVLNGETLVGYFDNADISFYLDDEGPAEEKYTFVTQSFTNWSQSVGSSLTIGSDSYRITRAAPDGTGLLVLNLYAE